MYENVCVLIKHSRPLGALVTYAPLPPAFSFPRVKEKNSFIHFLLSPSLPVPSIEGVMIPFERGKEGHISQQSAMIYGRVGGN